MHLIGRPSKWTGKRSAGQAPLRRSGRDAVLLAAVLLVAFGCLEVLLRIADFRELRDGYGRGYPVVFQHDAGLGWLPIPNTAGPFQGSRTFNVSHNSLGLRDVELEGGTRPTVLFVGDSFVWG